MYQIVQLSCTSVQVVILTLSSAPALLVTLVKIVKLTSMTAHHHHCVTMASVKTASTTLPASVTMDSKEGSVM